MREGLQMVYPSLFLFLCFFLLRSDKGKFTLPYCQPPPTSLPTAPPFMLTPNRPLNDRRHLALWTWRDPIQDEMEAYFGKPTKALKCKPPAACLAVDVFVLVERAAVAFHRGTWQKRRAMCGLLIFKPPVCQVSAIGMRPHTHTHTQTHMPNPFPTILSLSFSLSLSPMEWCHERGHISFGVVISLFMICLEIKLRMEQPLVQIKGFGIAGAI